MGSTARESESAAALLREGCAELALETDPRRLEALLQLALLLEAWAQRINLTGHRGVESIVRGLILEAAALHAAMPDTPSVADLGSGAGFPGLPLAILAPERAITLVEARLRRHHFQRAAVRELGLENVRLKHGRAESVERQPHEAVVAQAMARPERALAWMAPWAAPGGRVLLPCSSRPPEIRAPGTLIFERTVRYRVPCGGPARVLWIARRSA